MTFPDRPPMDPTGMDRRQLFRLAGSVGLLSVALSVAPLVAAPRVNREPVAFLLPLTGASANLGLSMQRAASLRLPFGGRPVLATAVDTNTGAAAAARAAIKGGARMIVGPVFSGDVRPVLAEAAGRVPVLSFSNDVALYESGAFLLGITASQLATAVLRYGRQRGLRRIGLLAGDGAWATQVAATCARLQGELGYELVPVARPADLAGLGLALGRLTGGVPDALLVADAGEGFAAAARGLAGSGVQLLGMMQAVDYAPAALQAMAGAWIAAPDPTVFGTFATAYQAQHGGTPGTIAALAYDAAGIVQTLRAQNRIDRAGLLAMEAYRGVTGTLKFRSDGSCVRELSILVAGPDGYQVAAASASA
ncbi:ABC transporter substrate-binding protein [Sphingomonas montana]|uniref:ABC transporter substrate-binding protein n=1 Tax=Sphingomonas montana TaxID=1843236 RepID=UPI001F0A8F3D|nr:ABC transporter substrate-binding protein [Sphingomonas montana]